MGVKWGVDLELHTRSWACGARRLSCHARETDHDATQDHFGPQSVRVGTAAAVTCRAVYGLMPSRTLTPGAVTVRLCCHCEPLLVTLVWIVCRGVR
jgi:hypothetical protein